MSFLIIFIYLKVQVLVRMIIFIACGGRKSNLSGGAWDHLYTTTSIEYLRSSCYSTHSSLLLFYKIASLLWKGSVWIMNKRSGLFLVFELTVVCLPYSCHITESYTKPSQKYPTTCMFLFRCYSRLSSNFLEKAHNKPVLDKSAFGLVLNSMPYLRNVKSIGFAYNFSWWHTFDILSTFIRL